MRGYPSSPSFFSFVSIILHNSSLSKESFIPVSSSYIEYLGHGFENHIIWCDTIHYHTPYPAFLLFALFLDQKRQAIDGTSEELSEYALG